MSEQKRPEICEYCALGDHDAYICARWRLSYAVNELKKAVPLWRDKFFEKFGQDI